MRRIRNTVSIANPLLSTTDWREVTSPAVSSMSFHLFHVDILIISQIHGRRNARDIETGRETKLTVFGLNHACRGNSEL
jgi:hypothetical protein